MIERLLKYEAQQSGAEVLDSAGVPPPIQEADLARLLAALAQARQRWPTQPELTEETEATGPVLELTCDEEGPLGIDYDGASEDASEAGRPPPSDSIFSSDDDSDASSFTHSELAAIGLDHLAAIFPGMDELLADEGEIDEVN
jgi:hypothetical protein